MSMNPLHPVLVIGAGPIGLAAAAHLLERGQEVRVLEAGPCAGSAIQKWGHLKLFSTWGYNIDAAARRLLQTPREGYRAPWQAPRESRLPTGNELIKDYLAPLAAHPVMEPRVSYGHRVTDITRVADTGSGVDKTSSAQRGRSLFLVRTATYRGTEDILARAVIDASGTWNTPNPVGRSGLEAVGEATARESGFISSPLPDPLGAELAGFANKTVLVLGAGHSAANTLISLGRLRQKHPDTTILWGLRSTANPRRLYGGGSADQLPARGELGTSLRRLVENGDITIFENASVSALQSGVRLGVKLADGRALDVDRLVPATGFRPDLSMLSELRLDLDHVVEAPRELGPLIDPEFHSCGTVSAHGASVLSHPEPDFYIAGSKSYGRAPTFLMATGYEQVRSIAAALAGDRAGADPVQLSLPETGVCSAESTDSCDAPAAPCAPEDSCCGTGTPNGHSEFAGAPRN